jgi:hypothetical protein
MGKKLHFIDHKYKEFKKACSSFTVLVGKANNEDLTTAAISLMNTINLIVTSIAPPMIVDSSEVHPELNRARATFANDGLRNFPDSEMSGEIMVALDRVVDTFKAFFDSQQRTMRDLDPFFAG